MATDILVVGLAVLGFGLVAGRLRNWPVTMPMLFTAVGLLLGPDALGVLQLDVENRLVGSLAEATLVVVLFTDSSRMELRTVVRQHSLALRLLGIGLPLTIAAGMGAGALLLPGLGATSVALLAATLAPTDAALGQAFVVDTSIPARIRQTLNVESGLNDGLAVPFITVLIDIARHETGSVAGYVWLFVRLAGVGAGVGAAIGWTGGRLLQASDDHGWSTATTKRLSTIAVAAVAYAAAELLGGNGFVAAFAAGLVIGTTARALLPQTAAFAEAEGQLLSLITFLLFGTVMVADVLGELSWRILAYAIVSLVVVRPVAVAIALLGAGLRPGTVAFVGWAGPRGLASIVCAVLIAETSDVPEAELIFVIAAWTILLSIYAHGVSATTLSGWYGRYMHRDGAATPEHHPVTVLPVRLEGNRGIAPATRADPPEASGGADGSR